MKGFNMPKLTRLRIIWDQIRYPDVPKDGKPDIPASETPAPPPAPPAPRYAFTSHIFEKITSGKTEFRGMKGGRSYWQDEGFFLPPSYHTVPGTQVWGTHTNIQRQWVEAVPFAGRDDQFILNLYQYNHNKVVDDDENWNDATAHRHFKDKAPAQRVQTKDGYNVFSKERAIELIAWYENYFRQNGLVPASQQPSAKYVRTSLVQPPKP
jgi:hypothetical protein